MQCLYIARRNPPGLLEAENNRGFPTGERVHRTENGRRHQRRRFAMTARRLTFGHVTRHGKEGRLEARLTSQAECQRYALIIHLTGLRPALRDSLNHACHREAHR